MEEARKVFVAELPGSEVGREMDGGVVVQRKGLEKEMELEKMEVYEVDCSPTGLLARKSARDLGS